MQLGHPRAAAGDGQVRSDAQLAQGRCHISGVGLGDLRSHIPPPMGCRACPAGFRLRLSRAYLAFSAQPRPADRAYKNTSAELDPSDSGWYAAEAAPILGGHMRGRIGTSARIAPRAFAFVCFSCSVVISCGFFSPRRLTRLGSHFRVLWFALFCNDLCT